MKISVITACYNSVATIRTAMESVWAQRGADVEYIVVDGGSTDGTVDILKEYSARSTRSTRPNLSFKWLSEPDHGMYDAINKGIKMATGEIIGILNADDVLASDDTLAHIADAFESPEGGSPKPAVDCVYADIRFVTRLEAASPKSGEPGMSCGLTRQDAASPRWESVEALRNAPTVRYCSAAKWKPWMFRFAAMVPHPSFYVRRACFERLGGYSLDYRICADFELELRYLYLAKLKAAYLPECVVVMRMGGMSTAGWRANVEINREDLRALRAHGIWSCLSLIYLKYLFKIWGFVLGRQRHISPATPSRGGYA